MRDTEVRIPPSPYFSLTTVHRLTDDHVIKHLDLKNPGRFAQPAGKAKIGRFSS